MSYFAVYPSDKSTNNNNLNKCLLHFQTVVSAKILTITFLHSCLFILNSC